MGAWAANALGERALASIYEAANLPLVHVSTDYVFDGSPPWARSTRRGPPAGTAESTARPRLPVRVAADRMA